MARQQPLRLASSAPLEPSKLCWCIRTKRSCASSRRHVAHCCAKRGWPAIAAPEQRKSKKANIAKRIPTPYDVEINCELLPVPQGHVANNPDAPGVRTGTSQFLSAKAHSWPHVHLPRGIPGEYPLKRDGARTPLDHHQAHQVRGGKCRPAVQMGTAGASGEREANTEMRFVSRHTMAREECGPACDSSSARGR